MMLNIMLILSLLLEPNVCSLLKLYRQNDSDDQLLIFCISFKCFLCKHFEHIILLFKYDKLY